MARSILVVVVSFFIAQFSLAAHDSRVWSRSIMASCEFVFQVESDVVVKLPEIKKFSKVPLYLKAQLTNSWDTGPLSSEVFIVKVDDAQRAAFTFESMSVSRGFLFREMSFQWVYEHSEGNFVALSPVQRVDVGRRFGEECHTARFSDEQFVERELL